MTRRFERAPKRAQRIPPSERLALIERIESDPRYLALKPSAKLVVSRAARHADGKGWLSVKNETLAKEMGVSTSTVKRAWSAAIAAGLVERRRYLRPDGYEGASNSYFDPKLVWPEIYAQGGSDATKLVDEREKPSSSFDATSWATGEPLTRWITPDPVELVQNWTTVEEKERSVLGTNGVGQRGEEVLSVGRCADCRRTKALRRYEGVDMCQACVDRIEQVVEPA